MRYVQVVTLEGWTPIMYWTADCTTGWVVIYYLLIVFSGSFYVLNLGLAVVSSSHEDSQHEEEEAQHAAEESSAAGGPVPMSPARRRMKEAEEAEAKQEKARQLTGVRKYMHDVVQSDQFTNFVTACILFNTIVLAINYYGASKTYQDVLEAMNTVCTFVFLVRLFSLSPTYASSMVWTLQRSRCWDTGRGLAESVALRACPEDTQLLIRSNVCAQQAHELVVYILRRANRIDCIIIGVCRGSRAWDVDGHPLENSRERELNARAALSAQTVR